MKGLWKKGIATLARWDLFLTIAAILLFRFFIATPFLIRGASMEPTLEDRNLVILDRASYRLRKPEVGEIVIFHPPGRRISFIKRIVGLPGDLIEIRNMTVLRNGFEVDEPYLLNREKMHPLTVRLGPDEYFVLGDNRGASSDSREWGPLPRQRISGRVLAVIWPPSKTQAFSP